VYLPGTPESRLTSLLALYAALSPPSQAACEQSCALEQQDTQGCCPPVDPDAAGAGALSRPGVALPLERGGGPVLDENGYELVLLPPGLYAAGSARDAPGHRREERRHNVELTGALWVGATEVTRVLYLAVTERAPWEASGAAESAALPATGVSWLDAVSFCNALSYQEGLSPAYTISPEGSVSWDRGAGGYRLLTEAEWEYAAKAGGDPVWAGVNAPGALCGFANVAPGSPCDDGFDQLAPVASLSPNPWGLYDLSGNALEWVWDWYGDYSDELADPRGPRTGQLKVARGGSWWLPPEYARVARRYWAPPDHRDEQTGFRIARPAAP
jgi:sulfatase modifying factor 1